MDKINQAIKRYYPILRSPEERFFSKILDTGTCWLWMGYVSTQGYGIFYIQSEPVHAYKVSYMFFKGPVPKGLEIDHVCRVRHCVNPVHLEAVTHQENMRRGLYGQKTHCPKGHPYSPENTYKSPRKQHRVCKTCRRIGVAMCENRRKNAN
jgi:hypothetical protein